MNIKIFCRVFIYFYKIEESIEKKESKIIAFHINSKMYIVFGNVSVYLAENILFWQFFFSSIKYT